MAKVKKHNMLLSVTKEDGEILVSATCTWIDLFSIARQMITMLEANSDGNASYNEILDDLKEVGLSETNM